MLTIIINCIYHLNQKIFEIYVKMRMKHFLFLNTMLLNL